MEKYYRQTIGSPVITRLGEVLTRVTDIILDTEKGKIVGFAVAAGRTKVVAPIDIVNWNQSITIGDSGDIIEVEDVIHIQKTLEKGVTIVKKRVFTKSGDYIGKVLDYGMNNKYFELTCIIVAKNFLGIVYWDKKIISAKDIIEIKKDRIVVKDLVTPLKMKKFQVDMAATS